MTTPFIDHTKVPAFVSDACLARRVSCNPYIQHVWPGLKLSLARDPHPPASEDADPMQIDRAQSARVYWEAVSENARAEGLQGTCGDSYGTNALAMMFAFAYGSGVNYNTPLTLAFHQALALHQASGLVDAISYTRPAMSQEQRVVRSAIPSTGTALHCSQQPGPRGRHGSN